MDVTDLTAFTVDGTVYEVDRQLPRRGEALGLFDCRDRLGRHRLLTLVPISADTAVDKVAAIASLDDSDSETFARLTSAAVVSRPAGDNGALALAVVEDWINGQSLRNLVDAGDFPIRPSLILAYLDIAARADRELRARNLAHSALNLENIVMRRPAATSPDIHASLRISGLAFVAAAADGGHFHSEHARGVAESLIDLHNAARRQPQSVAERVFLDRIADVLVKLSGSTDSLLDPLALGNELREALLGPVLENDGPLLASPFSAMSAEQMADDASLVHTFARSVPWFDKVAKPDPCVLVGPRGCGKSTIFRWLALKPHVKVWMQTPESEGDFEPPHPLGGFYLSCSSDLQGRVRWVDEEGLAFRLRNEVIHLFNLLMAREVYETISLVARQDKSGPPFQVSDNDERHLWQFLTSQLQRSDPLVVSGTGCQQAVELLEDEIFRTYSAMRRRKELPWTTGHLFLSDLARLLRRRFSYFRNHPVTYLVDDFSVDRLSEPVQTSLNEVLWQRQSDYIVKVSTDYYDFTPRDRRGASLDEGREFKVIDCGREYFDIHSSATAHEQFARDLLANRLSAAGYAAGPDELLPTSEWKTASLGKALHARARSKKRRGPRDDIYHGLDVIATICSGDVATILLVAERIFSLGGVDASTRGAVKAHVQHEAIVEVSRRLVAHVRSHHPFGPRMHGLLVSYGTFMRNTLENGRELNVDGGKVPQQVPRVEIDDPDGDAIDGLSPPERSLYYELVRRSVFIELSQGRSRHGNVPTVRIHLRRAYVPFFGCAFAKTDSVKWTKEVFARFLADPRAVLDDEQARRSGRSRGGRGDSPGTDLPLFDGDTGEPESL